MGSVTANDFLKVLLKPGGLQDGFRRGRWLIGQNRKRLGVKSRNDFSDTRISPGGPRAMVGVMLQEGVEDSFAEKVGGPGSKRSLTLARIRE